MTKSVVPAAPVTTRKRINTIGTKLRRGIGVIGSDGAIVAVGKGRGLSASAADKINFGSADAGAWGTTIFRKQVGQEIFEPTEFAPAVICWPQTGQANLNSLMTLSKDFTL